MVLVWRCCELQCGIQLQILEELRYKLLGARRIRIGVGIGQDPPLQQGRKMRYLGFDLLEV